MGEREDEQLPVVGEALSHRLGRSFCRVVPRPPGATHDLETCDGARPTIAAEVKELVPGEFLSVQKAVLGDQGLDSNVLSRRWGVIIDEEPLSGRLVPTPPFHDDPPPDEIEKWAAHGFIVTRKSELEQAWQARQSLARRPSILVKNLARDIEPHLAVLEQLGIFETRTWPEPVDREEFLAAIAALGVVAKRTGGAICKAHPPIGDQKPGVDLWFGYSPIRTGDANVVAERVQMWLDSAVSANLRESLANSGADERHAALWLSSEGEVQSATEQGIGFCPTQPMRLAEEINVLWVFMGNVLLRFDGRWSSSLLA